MLASDIDMIDEEVTSHSLVPETSDHPAVTFSSHHASPYGRKDRLTVPLPLNGIPKLEIASVPEEPVEESVMIPISPRSSVPHSAASSTNPLIPLRKASFQFLRRWSPRERHMCYLTTFMLLILLALLTALIVTLLNPCSRIFTANNQNSTYTVQDGEWTGLARKGSPNGGTEESFSVCLSESCVKAANDLLEAMDQKADPCQDFYQYACGGWLRKNVVPDDKSRYSIFSKAKETLELVLKEVLDEEVDPRTDIPSTADAKRMYKACMNESLIEEKASQPAFDVLEQYVSWPVIQTPAESEAFLSTFDWAERTAILRRDGGSYLISLGVWADSKDTTKQIIYIDQPGVGMPSAEYMMRGLSDKYVKAYYNFMMDTALLLGAQPDIAARDLPDVLDFEIALAKIKTPREERRDASKQYNKMTLAQLQNQTGPGFDWLKYVLTIVPPDLKPPVTAQEEVIVSEPVFFNKLFDLINVNTSKRTVANYLGWRVMLSVVWDLDTRFREIYNKYRNVLYGTSVEKSRWRSCTALVGSYFDLAVGKLYVDRTFRNGSREKAEEMITDISTAFLDILLNETDWMDDEAKAFAREKALAISRKIGYPDMIYNNTAMAQHFNGTMANETEHFQNVLINSRVWAQKSVKELRDPFDKSKWATSPAEVNAFYSTDYNSITFPAGILQPPFFEKDRPKSINYGAIGMVIGHEITHGFDDQGRQKDKDGNLRDWWPTSTVQRFKNRTQCIIDQYEGFTVPEVNMTVNGVNTQGENIADNGGLKQAYRAYAQCQQRTSPTQEEPRLPGLVHHSHQQLFFLSYAHIWCGLSRPDAYANDILSGVHSPDKFRVIGPLRNLPEFSEAFKCPVGSPMNPPSHLKCKVW